jgi:DNA-binding XRE family transcriptional regulator
MLAMIKCFTRRKKMMTYFKFKNKIKEYRENHGVTAKQLAEAIEKSVSIVYQMERTKGFPRGNTRVKIMNFLGASFNELFYEEEAKKWQ